MAVSRSEFIEIANRYGYSEERAISDYEFMIGLGFNFSKMAKKDIEEFYENVRILEITPPKIKKKSFFSRLFSK